MRHTLEQAQTLSRKFREDNNRKKRDELRNTEDHQQIGIRQVMNSLDELISRTIRGNALGIQMVSQYENQTSNNIEELIHNCPSQNPHREMSEAILAATKLTPAILERVEMALLLSEELFDDRDFDIPVGDFL